jgi:hypothetical protein
MCGGSIAKREDSTEKKKKPNNRINYKKKKKKKKKEEKEEKEEKKNYLKNLLEKLLLGEGLATVLDFEHLGKGSFSNRLGLSIPSLRSNELNVLLSDEPERRIRGASR